MMGKRTITLLALLLLVGGPYASFAQQDQQATPATPFRIGIFPGGGEFDSSTGDGGVEERVARVLQTNIKENPALVLAYSYYDKVLNEPRIKNRGRLWVGGQLQKKPNTEVVYRLARERGLDGVVMCWGVQQANPWTTAKPNPMWVYLIDVERRQVDHRKGTAKKSDVDKLTRNVLAQFLAERPQVVLAKATPFEPATVAPTPAPTKKVVTPAPTVAQVVPAATTPGTVTLIGGTTVPVVLTENINSKYNTTGALVYLRVTEDIKVGDKVAIPKGALVKAKIGDIAKRGMMGKAGGLTFHPVAVAALDGQWVSVDREDFGAHGGGASVGGIVGMGLFAKGAAGYVLRGTEYEVTVRRDAVIDTGKRKPLAALRKADFQTAAKFQVVKKKIKFARGKPGDDFVLDITLTQDITSLVQQKPSAVRIVEILDHVLRKPIKPIKVVIDPKKDNFLSATFAWWSLVKYAQPGKTPMTVQLELADGRLAQAQATLETEWKLK